MTVCAPILIALSLLAGVWLLVVFSNPTDQRAKSWLGLLGVPYGLLLLAGFFLVGNRIGSAAQSLPEWIEAPQWGLGAPTVHYRAAGRLPAGHLLRAADLAPPPGLPSGLRGRLPPASSLAGKYLEQEVSAGEPIPLELLDDEPPAAGPAGVVEYPLAAGSPLLEEVDAGDVAMLARKAEKPPSPCLGLVEVLFLSCPRGFGEPCSFSLAVPEELIEEIATVPRSEIELEPVFSAKELENGCPEVVASQE